jgi:hypothetical protein
MLSIDSTRIELSRSALNLYRILMLAMIAMTGFLSQAASAQTLQLIQVVPSGWIIQNYVPNGVVLFNTGSPCMWGGLYFPPNAVQADYDRLWALILAAKIAAQQVIVYWYTSGSNCYISSFGLAPS